MLSAFRAKTMPLADDANTTRQSPQHNHTRGGAGTRGGTPCHLNRIRQLKVNDRGSSKCSWCVDKPARVVQRDPDWSRTLRSRGQRSQESSKPFCSPHGRKVPPLAAVPTLSSAVHSFLPKKYTRDCVRVSVGGVAAGEGGTRMQRNNSATESRVPSRTRASNALMPSDTPYHQRPQTAWLNSAAEVIPLGAPRSARHAQRDARAPSMPAAPPQSTPRPPTTR